MKTSSKARLTPCILGLGLLLPACSRTPVEPPGGPSADSGQPKQDEVTGIGNPLTQRTLKELFGSPGDVAPERSTGHPDLDFEEISGVLPATGTWREHPLLTDLNGDGLDDLVASNREEEGLHVWLRTAAGSWEPSLDGLPRDLMYGGSEAADLDGDGRRDLIFAAHKLHARVFLNKPLDGNPDGIRWEEVPGALECTFLGLDVALGNLNGDGFSDAVIISQFAMDRATGGLAVYFGRGDGTFERQTEHSTLLGRSRCGHQVECTDLDGDGLDDILVAAEWGLQVFFARRDTPTGAVRFEERSQGLKVPENIGNSLYSFVACELTGTAPLEVAFCGLADPAIPEGERNNAGAYRWTGEGWEQFDQGLPNQRAFRDILSADFNADGHGDLVLSGPGQGVVLFLGDGAGMFKAQGQFQNTGAGGNCSIGDVDQDGRPDIAISNGATKRRPDAGGVKVFLNRAVAFEE